MTISLNLFFKDFEGKWLSQKNIYLLKNKKQKINNTLTKVLVNQDNIILLNSQNLFYSYSLDYLNKNLLNNFYLEGIKCNKNSLSEKLDLSINLKFISLNLLKINCILAKKNLQYEEYLYSASNNLKISLGLLKKLNYKKYIGIVITSYIKIR